MESDASGHAEQALLQLVASDVRSRGIGGPVTLGSSFQYDLDFDSLGLLQLIGKCDDVFDVDLRQECSRVIKSVGDLLAAIQEARDDHNAVVPVNSAGVVADPPGQGVVEQSKHSSATINLRQRQKSVVILVVIVISVAWTLYEWARTDSLTALVSRMAFAGAALVLTESLFIVGALAMALSVGTTSRVIGGISWARLVGIRSMVRPLCRELNTSKLFGIGYWLNFLGAVGSSAVLIAMAILFMPVGAAGLLLVLGIDLFVSCAWRIGVFRARHSHIRKKRIRVRQATQSDIDAYVALQAERWSKDSAATKGQLESRLRAYPKGMIVAENGAGIVGMAFAMRITAYDFNTSLSWNEITRDGYCDNLDVNGNDLFGVDLSTSSISGSEAGDQLLARLAQLAVSEGVAHALLGGRLPDYHRYSNSMTVDEYIQAKTADGQCLDRQLRFYLQVPGLVALKALPDYFDDPDSLNNGVLLCWRNPFHGIPGKRVWSAAIPALFRMEKAYRQILLRRRNKDMDRPF